jgi:hypothetical protein
LDVTELYCCKKIGKGLTKVITKINTIENIMNFGGYEMLTRCKAALCLLLILMSAGCAKNNAVNLVNYTNQGILMIAELEQKSLERYASVTGDNYTSDQRVHDELKNFIIPTYKRFVDGLKNIKVEDEEIKRVHSIYINAADLMYNGFVNKMIGIEKANDPIIIKANENIEKAAKDCERWRQELFELYKKYHVSESKSK